MKLVWLPRYLEGNHVVEALSALGVVRCIKMEKGRVGGMENVEKLNREQDLTL